MNDQFLCNSYLLLLKSTVEVYVHGTLESSNKKVRQTLQECLNDTMDMQGNTYLKMVDNGWYNVDNIPKDKIHKTLEKEKQ